MVQSSNEAKRNRNVIVSFVHKYRSWFPLGVSGAILLLGLLPMLSAPEVSAHVNIYQLDVGPILRFVIAPIIVAVIWAVDFFVRDFGRFTKFAITAAAAIQLVSITLLLHVLSLRLTMFSMYPYTAITEAVPTQALSVGAWLVLGISVLFLIDCGLQLTKKETKSQQPKTPIMPAMPAKEPSGLW